MRTAELLEAAGVLGIGDEAVTILDHADGMLPWVEAGRLEADIHTVIRTTAPDVVITFGEDGLYWHPDHIAVHERTTAAVAALHDDAPALYYVTMPAGAMRAVVSYAAEVTATRDPNALRDGGALLPLGGSEGYKGYGLSVMVEILSGILPGLGFGHEPSGRHNDGIFMAAFRVDAFLDLDQFKSEVTEFAHYLKATPTAEGFDEIYYPGEIEYLTTQRKLVDGVDIEDSTWAKLTALGEEYGLSSALGLG